MNRDSKCRPAKSFKISTRKEHKKGKKFLFLSFFPVLVGKKMSRLALLISTD
ncbi:Uncharacterized protein dnm_038880 [Desulfonema magnum]|uniref:Uncharacterized protein n=1 Tax=Desulfonema magnum TaxID=45655 RepID=A0A975BMX6_9BACT|nr:Uncharacterized protein dnm_038880 [Desulfonema magnum]